MGREAVVAATLARDVDAGPRLIRLAGQPGVPRETRKSAVFWASQNGAPLSELRALYARAAEVELREQVIFAYSQRADPRAARELLRIARSAGPAALRDKAVFWLGQAAGGEVTRELGELVRADDVDAEIQEQAVFALSRRPRGEGVPALIRVAREHPRPEVRKMALFWLSQSGDPRAVDLFEDILARH